MKSLMPFIFIILAGGLFFVFTRTHYDQVAVLSAQSKEYKEALKKAEELRAVRDNLLSKFNSIPEADLKKLERIVPDKVNIVKLVADIDSIAGKYGITIKSVKVNEESVDQFAGVTDTASQKAYKTTTVSFRFTATYDNLVNYLKDLEKSLQVIDVRAVTFESGQAKGGLYDYEIGIQIYSLR